MLCISQPFGALDEEANGHVGCSALWDAVARVRPYVHVFGHVHEERGAVEAVWPPSEAPLLMGSRSHTTFLNVAILNDEVNLHKPLVFDFYVAPTF